MRRQVIAVLSLLGGLDSSFLLLHKLGVISALACTSGSACNVVNSSSYSSFLGLPVAGIGLAGYLLIFAIALASTQPNKFSEPKWDRLLALLAGGGALFSAYLTFASLYFIETACPYCLVSFAIILTITVLALWGAVN